MQPLIDQLIQSVGMYLSRLIGGLLLLIVAWIVANVAKRITRRGLEAARFDQRVGSQTGGTPLSKTLSDIVYGLVWLLFLPAILGTLGLQGLFGPVENMVNRLLAFLPNILAAGIIFMVGLLVARILRQIVTNILIAMGADRLSQRLGLQTALGSQGLPGVAGIIVYVLIMIPVTIAALQALAIDALTRPAVEMLNVIFLALPAIAGAAIVLIVGIIIGRVASGLVSAVLTGLGVNSLPARLGMKEPAASSRTLADWVGTFVLVAIVFLAAVEASRMLGFLLIADLAAQFMVFAGQVIGGVLIFALGLYLANLAAGAIASSGAENAGTLAMGARIAILVLVGAMALRAMGVANEIINLAFGLLLGAAAVAAALAFGLGGRDFAARRLNEWSRDVKE